LTHQHLASTARHSLSSTVQNPIEFPDGTEREYYARDAHDGGFPQYAGFDASQSAPVG
jgi:hypothetical protein